MTNLIVSSKELRRRELENKRRTEGNGNGQRLYSDHSFKMLVPLSAWSYFAGRSCGLALPENFEQYNVSLAMEVEGNLFDPFNNLDDYLLIYDWMKEQSLAGVLFTVAEDIASDSHGHKYATLRTSDFIQNGNFTVHTHMNHANGETEAFRLSYIRVAAYIGQVHRQNFFLSLRRKFFREDEASKLFKYDTHMEG